jgi:hypothetical protein
VRGSGRSTDATEAIRDRASATRGIVKSLDGLQERPIAR